MAKKTKREAYGLKCTVTGVVGYVFKRGRTQMKAMKTDKFTIKKFSPKENKYTPHVITDKLD